MPAVRSKARSADVMDVDNFGGMPVFEVSRISRGERRAFSCDGPATLTPRSCRPTAAPFVDTTLRPSDTMSVTAGVRYDWQSDVADWNNLSPRVTVAVAPAGSKMVFRGGAGLFYQTVSTRESSCERGSSATAACARRQLRIPRFPRCRQKRSSWHPARSGQLVPVSRCR